MKKIFCLLILCPLLLLAPIAYAEAIEPLKDIKEIQQVVDKVHAASKENSPFLPDEKTALRVTPQGEFVVSPHGFALKKIYKVDADNDGKEEYVIVASDGALRLMYLDGVFDMDGRPMEQKNLTELFTDNTGSAETRSDASAGFKKENGKTYLVIRRVHGKLLEADDKTPYWHRAEGARAEVQEYLLGPNGKSNLVKTTPVEYLGLEPLYYYQKSWGLDSIAEVPEFMRGLNETFQESLKEKKETEDRDKKDADMFALIKKLQGAGDAEAYQALGAHYRDKTEDADRATMYFKKAVALNPNLYLSWFSLGLLHISEEEGNEYLRNTVKAKPDFAEPYYWLAYNLCRVRKDKEAIPLFERYLEVAQKDKAEQAQGPSRIDVAREVLADLRSGKEGESLRNMRIPTDEASENVLFPKESGERIDEDFNHPDLLEDVKALQKEVDAGSWPWRLNPVEYAAVFLGAVYGGHSEEMDAENFPENYPGSVDVKGDNAIVKLNYRGKKHIVYMHKAFPSNPNSLWFVDKVVSID